LPIIIDRRKNPGKKNLSNRQRFIDRFKGQIRDAAKKSIGDRSITDSGDQEITIPGTGTDEPRFTHRQDGGEWDYILPGNRDYVPGDTIDKPQGGAGGGRGTEGSRGNIGEDEFQFVLSYDEYLDIIFDDLELPDLVKASEKVITAHKMRRAGFTTAGVPSNLNVERTAIAGIGRRMALRSTKISRIRELEALLETEADPDEKAKIIEEIQELKIRANAVSFLDRVDLRYNNFVPQPIPVTRAVMFCVMDVSYSMGESEKIIAKKFFLLLHLFLRRQYKDIDVVFVRHHEEAEECDEETFFTSRASGGTVVSTAYEEVHRIIKDRYSPDEWNIYVAQASDGDNFSNDKNRSMELLEAIIKTAQFMAYIEISRRQPDLLFAHETDLWSVIDDVRSRNPKIAMQIIHREDDVISVFRKFFERTKG
jgi:uncharacterized sporulation protein YeaH/YhbH (DUF444 family)